VWGTLTILVAGCAPFSPVLPSETITPITSPSLLTTSLLCDEKDEVWRLLATTDSWIGSAELLLSTDGVEIEQHPAYSVGADINGLADELDLTLDIIADWRDVEEGDTTAFLCTQEPAGLLRVYSVEGVLSDCWSSHPTSKIWGKLDDCAMARP
jgi:hypothetical protein